MIYTLTFNPSLDYITIVEDFKLGMINHTNDEMILCGGKGINVSIVLKNLGYDSIAFGYIGGFTGLDIKRRLDEIGCSNDFVEVSKGISRINVKLKSNEETELNGRGPIITSEELEKLFVKLNNLKSGDILVLAGSIPTIIPDDIYEKIMELLSTRNVKFVVDATKDLLVNTLKYNPFLIKPNNFELGQIFNVDIKTKEDVITYGKKLQEMGARNVLVSMAGDGAVLIDENNNVFKSNGVVGNVVNSVGAGDSMVAGFIAGYLEKKDLEYAFKLGIAAGTASAFSKHLATIDEVNVIMNKL